MEGAVGRASCSKSSGPIHAQRFDLVLQDRPRSRSMGCRPRPRSRRIGNGCAPSRTTSPASAVVPRSVALTLMCEPSSFSTVTTQRSASGIPSAYLPWRDADGRTVPAADTTNTGEPGPHNITFDPISGEEMPIEQMAVASVDLIASFPGAPRRSRAWGVAKPHPIEIIEQMGRLRDSGWRPTTPWRGAGTPPLHCDKWSRKPEEGTTWRSRRRRKRRPFSSASAAGAPSPVARGRLGRAPAG